MWLRLVPVVMVFVCIVGGRSAFGVTVLFAHGDAPRAEQWETLDVGVEVPAGGGGVVSIQDARGGLTVDRTVEGGGGETLHVWMPLPFLQASDLSVDEWPINVTMTPATSVPQVQRVGVQRVGVRRPAGAVGGTFRVAVCIEGAADSVEQSVPWQEVTSLPRTFTRVLGTEVLSGPALNFAAFDALLMTRTARAKMEDGRVMALVSVGVQLVVVEDAMEGASQAASPDLAQNPEWIFPRQPLRRPVVLEPGLAASSLFTAEVVPPLPLKMAIALVGPAAIVVVLIVRGLFRQRTWVFVGSLVGLAGIAVLGVGVCQQMAEPVTRRVEWSEAVVGEAGKSESAHAPAVELVETGKSVTPLFSQTVNPEVPDRAVLCPVAGSAREYFGWKNARFSVDADVVTGNGGGLSITVPSRSAVSLFGRSASVRRTVASEGWNLEGGYVSSVATTGAAGGPSERRLLTEWAADHAGIRESLLAWYALRYQPHHRYILHSGTAGSPEVSIEDHGVQAREPLQP